MKALAIDQRNQEVKHLAEATLRLCAAVDELKRSHVLPDYQTISLTYACDDAKGEARRMLNRTGGW
jgi:hypothetical protein